MKIIYACILLFYFLFIGSCISGKEENTSKQAVLNDPLPDISLGLDAANRLSALPFKCINTPLPYKPGAVIAKPSDLAMPQVHHPAFYGCFDWHSAVHGHWSLIYLLKKFPNLANAPTIKQKLVKNLSADHILKELDYFSMNKESATFERTYGWAWLLKLQEELYTWDDSLAIQLHHNLKPLANHIVKSYIDYLPKLFYPIRVGEHSNTAFGLNFAFDYAKATGDTSFLRIIKENAIRFYSKDENCPINWEPSGYDFLSPCLQEFCLMQKVLPEKEFNKWSNRFLPELHKEKLELDPGVILDRTDGKLVHLDGLNFSRAWCLFSLKDNHFAYQLGNRHLNYSLEKITDGNYAGQHWLTSFALYAFKIKEEKKHEKS